MATRRNPSIQTQVFTDKKDAEMFARLLRNKGRKVVVKRMSRGGEYPYRVKWISPEDRTKSTKKRNPLSVGLPRNKWVNARIRVTSSGKIQATVNENILGNLLGKGRKRNPNPWYSKGARAGLSGRYSDMYSAWKAQKGKPATYTSSGAVSGKGVEAKEYFFEGFLSVPQTGSGKSARARRGGTYGS